MQLTKGPPFFTIVKKQFYLQLRVPPSYQFEETVLLATKGPPFFIILKKQFYLQQLTKGPPFFTNFHLHRQGVVEPWMNSFQLIQLFIIFVVVVDLITYHFPMIFFFNVIIFFILFKNCLDKLILINSIIYDWMKLKGILN